METTRENSLTNKNAELHGVKEKPIIIAEGQPFEMHGQLYRWRKNHPYGIILESPEVNHVHQFTISNPKKSKRHGSRRKT